MILDVKLATICEQDELLAALSKATHRSSNYLALVIAADGDELIDVLIACFKQNSTAYHMSKSTLESLSLSFRFKESPIEKIQSLF